MLATHFTKEKLMKIRKLSVLVVLALIACAAVLSNNSNTKTKAALAVCTVPGDYATIQAAVNDVTCATINVAPGTYNENVIVTRNVTINGAQAGNNDFATRGANPAGESIVNGVPLTGSVPVFGINAAGVTITGFTV